MRLLDTDIMIDLVRRHPPAIHWFGSCQETLYMSGFVQMELIGGCTNKRDLAEVSMIARIIPTIWPSEAEMQDAVKIFAQYHLSHSLGLLDSLIAATALGRGATLCTFNVKHYAAVPGLTLEQPYTR